MGITHSLDNREESIYGLLGHPPQHATAKLRVMLQPPLGTNHTPVPLLDEVSGVAVDRAAVAQASAAYWR